MYVKSQTQIVKQFCKRVFRIPSAIRKDYGILVSKNVRNGIRYL